MDEKKVREAIEVLKNKIDIVKTINTPGLQKHAKRNAELYSISIKALKKQLPEKPTLEGDGCDPEGNIILDEWLCPHCNTRYEVDYDRYFYCPNCGQKIRWSEEDE